MLIKYKENVLIIKNTDNLEEIMKTLLTSKK